MKKYMTLALIGAIVAGIAGLISIDATSATSLVSMQGASDFHESGLMIGHVTYEVLGADGHVKQYLQGDNLITKQGTDCAAQVIFDDGDLTPDVCTLGGNGGFAFIAIGNSTNAVPLASLDDTALDDDLTGGKEIHRSAFIDATIVANGGAGTIVTISNSGTPFTFTDLGPSGTTITQSGLFDAPTAGNMFSIRDIPVPSGGGILVNNADTLAVTWTITLT
ncbi:MAG: hypothetical protein ACREAK_00895 [Nitrosarchaeum sp.]